MFSLVLGRLLLALVGKSSCLEREAIIGIKFTFEDALLNSLGQVWDGN